MFLDHLLVYLGFLLVGHYCLLETFLALTINFLVLFSYGLEYLPHLLDLSDVHFFFMCSLFIFFILLIHVAHYILYLFIKDSVMLFKTKLGSFKILYHSFILKYLVSKSPVISSQLYYLLR